MSEFDLEGRNRNYTDCNTDMTCRGFDVFQDAVIFHSPVLGAVKEMIGEAKEYFLKKHVRKCAYFPCRSIALLLPNRGRVVLPRGDPDLEAMWNFYRDTLGFGEEQVIWFDHDIEKSFEYSFLRDAVAVDRLLSYIANTPKDDPKRRLLLFSNRPEFTGWAKEHGFNVVHDSKEWRDRYGFKGILHPRPSSETGLSFIEELGISVPVPKPRGFVCATRDELVLAAHLMQEKYPDVTDVLVKPVNGSDGDGIVFYSLSDDEGIRTYPFEMGEVCMEEKLNLDRHLDGSEVSVVTHYFADGLLGPSCDQLLGSATSVTAFNGNIFPSAVSREMRKQCENAVLAINAVTKPQGPGGFDFLFQNGIPYLVDVNSGRFNGGMNPKAFHKQFADRAAAYVSFKHTPRCSVSDCWTILKEHEIDFIPLTPATEGSEDPRVGIYGVFPLVHLPNNFGSYIALARTRADCLALKNQFVELNV